MYTMYTMYTPFNRYARKMLNVSALSMVAVTSAVSGAFAQNAANDEQPQRALCARTYDRNDMVENLPLVDLYLRTMERLPLTGQQVANIVKAPQNKIVTCFVSPGPPGEYSDRLVKISADLIATGGAMSAASHEYVHVAQDMLGGKDKIPTLTSYDAAFAMLLMEAVGVAYEITLAKEAQINGIKLDADSSKDIASNDPGNISAFNKAYDAAWASGNRLDRQTRIAKSLEAGGTAVVRHLLNGGVPGWCATYLRIALDNLGRLKIPQDGREKQPGYQERRTETLVKLANMLDRVHFLPAEYIGPDGPKTANNSMKKMIDANQALAAAQAKQKASPLPPK